MRPLLLAVMPFFFAILACPSPVDGQQGDYPWIHHFKRPYMPKIHCAFSDAEGDVIASTGDWDDSYTPQPGASPINVYWSEGLFRINQYEIHAIQGPANTYTMDGAIDSNGTTWLLVAEGIDYTQSFAAIAHESDRRKGTASLEIGYRTHRFPFRWGHLRDLRLATIENNLIFEKPEVTNQIPGEVRFICSGPDGQIFVASEQMDGDSIVESFISWWKNDPMELRTIEISESFENIVYFIDYPLYGPDDIVYLLCAYSGDDSGAHCVLSLDPETGESHSLRVSEYSFLNSKIYELFVDDFNIKWFATEVGLVRFDGEDWMRFTPDNSPLPYDRVRSIIYDDIDGVFYIGSAAEDWHDHPDDYVSLSIISLTGELISGNLFMPRGPLLHQGTNWIWYLMPGWDDNLIWTYDHDETREWLLRDWIDIPDYSAWDCFIGHAGSGRTFCATDRAIMIW